MSNRYKKRVRALMAKLEVSYQAADNILKARRRQRAGAVSGPANAEDARTQPADERTVNQEGAIDAEADRGVGAEAVRFVHPMVAADIAGWTALLGAGGALLSLLFAVAEGVTSEGIERELTRRFGRKHAMTLGQSLLPRSGAKHIETRAATARLAGYAPPRTFGDLLRVLVRVGVVTEHAGRYAVAFPPPAPEETLLLSPEQRAEVLWFRDVGPNTGGMSMLEECVRAEGPGFAPPAWMRAVLDIQQNHVPEERTPVYRPPGTAIIIIDLDADPVLCEQISRLFSTYLSEDPRTCPCGASISNVAREATSNADAILIKASCTDGHRGYMGKRVRDLYDLGSAEEAAVDLFLRGRPDGERVQGRDFYTHYVLWALAQRQRPAPNVTFARRVMDSGLYRRTERRPGGRTYHCLTVENSPAHA
jgi:Family of unknown function (DUF6042)